MHLRPAAADIDADEREGEDTDAEHDRGAREDSGGPDQVIPHAPHPRTPGVGLSAEPDATGASAERHRATATPCR